MDGETNQFDTLAPTPAEQAGSGAPEPVATEPVTAETVAGETVAAVETAEPTDAAEPAAGVDRLTPDQLIDYLSRASFPTVLGRRGYQQDEVDVFLAKLAASIREGEPLKELVRRNRFTTVRLEDGYDTHQVDDFLAAVVDLDPNAVPEPPEAGRSGLLTKLFG